jgi:hypothetical protein
MKQQTLVALFVAAFSLTSLPTASEAAPTGYPLHCKGGGNMTMMAANNSVKIRFHPGNSAVHTGLQPGMCTWSDRGFRGGEFALLCDNNQRASTYIGKLLRGEHVILQVYNDRRECMKVTRVGP